MVIKVEKMLYDSSKNAIYDFVTYFVKHKCTRCSSVLADEKDASTKLKRTVQKSISK